MTHIRIRLALCIGLAACVAGCASQPRTAEPAAKRAVLALLLPGRVEIVEPFTRWGGLNDDGGPSAIELMLRAVNPMDNPGSMIVGELRVELYEYVRASGQRRGKRLEQWDIDLSNIKQQEIYWNKLTQMYEFHLGVNPAVIPKARRYLLAVTYLSPLGERFVDECTLDLGVTAVRPAAERIGGR